MSITSVETSRYVLWSKNSFSYTIKTPSTNLSSVAIVCKWIISVIKSLSQLVHCLYNYPHYILLYAIMQNEDARMQKRTNLWHWVHWPKYRSWSYGTTIRQGHRGKLAEVFRETKFQKGNTISLQLRVSVTVLYTFYFAYSMLTVIDDLCVRRFHFILLIIRVDEGKVLIMDALRKKPEEWKDLRDMLQR